MFYIIVSITVCWCTLFTTPAEKIHVPEIFKALSSYNASEITALIIKHPSLIHKRFISGNYFIHYCIFYEALHSIKTHLIQPDILTAQNSRGQTALHYALHLYTHNTNNKPLLCHIIHLLIQHTHDTILLYKDIHGNTVFHTALFTLSPTIIAELYNRLLQINPKQLSTQNHQKKTPLHILIELFGKLNQPPNLKPILVQLLNNEHNNLAQQDEKGDTIAHVIAHFKLEKSLSLLKVHPALFKIKNNYHQLPIHILIHNFDNTQEDFLRIQQYTNHSLQEYYEEDIFSTSPARFYETHHPQYPKKTPTQRCYILNDFYKHILDPTLENQERSISLDSLESFESTEDICDLLSYEDFKDLQPAKEDQHSPEWYQY